MKEEEGLTSHDLDHMDLIDQENCNYGGRPLTINVNNISESLNFWWFRDFYYKIYENRSLEIRCQIHSRSWLQRTLFKMSKACSSFFRFLSVAASSCDVLFLWLVWMMEVSSRRKVTVSRLMLVSTSSSTPGTTDTPRRRSAAARRSAGAHQPQYQFYNHRGHTLINLYLHSNVCIVSGRGGSHYTTEWSSTGYVLVTAARHLATKCLWS